MKSCFCTIAFQKNKWGRDLTIDKPLMEILPILAAAGYDGVEIWGPHVLGMTHDELDQLARRLQELSLEAAMISPYFDFTSSEESAAASIRQGLAALSVARRLNAKGVRCFTGKVGSAEATAEQWDRTVRSVQELADATRPGRTQWVFETHSRNLMDTIESSLELVRRVDRPNVGLIFQPSTFKDRYLDALEQLGSHARHVHATNSRDGQRALLAEGDMDYEKIVAGLGRFGFEGYLSIEWMGENAAEVAAREAVTLRRLLGRD